MNKYIIIFFISIFCMTHVEAQELDTYQRIKDKNIQNRYVRHEYIKKVIQDIKKDADFSIQEEGKSIEGREIYSIKWGMGSTVLLLWSQMHGDESTATMAILDLIQYLKDSEIDKDLKKRLKNTLTIYIIPMLNPDGAEVFKRRNAIEVDLNRDAVRLQNPESQILKKVHDRVHPDYGFNLHDQSRYYAAGNTKYPATFSLLAPAYNKKKEINSVRKKSLQLCVAMNAFLQRHTPQSVGRYDDSFEARAFGDNVQKWGTSTILIECGGRLDDPEKQEIREVHFWLLIDAFKTIMSGAHLSLDPEVFFDIPENVHHLCDIKITDVLYTYGGQEFIVDIAINREHRFDKRNQMTLFSGEIVDIGDMRTMRGYREIDGKGLHIVWPTLLNEKDDKNQLWENICQGKAMINSKMSQAVEDNEEMYYYFEENKREHKINLDDNPSFYLAGKDKDLRYYVHNGKIYSLVEYCISNLEK